MFNFFVFLFFPFFEQGDSQVVLPSSSYFKVISHPHFSSFCKFGFWILELQSVSLIFKPSSQRKLFRAGSGGGEAGEADSPRFILV